MIPIELFDFINGNQYLTIMNLESGSRWVFIKFNLRS